MNPTAKEAAKDNARWGRRSSGRRFEIGELGGDFAGHIGSATGGGDAARIFNS